jgi:CBS-domain-containing membrane protein
MALIDEKFLRNRKRYFLQASLAFGAILVILIVLDAVTDAAVIASFGASSFIVLAMPHQEVSAARRVLGGSLIGAGVAFSADLIQRSIVSLFGKVFLVDSVILFGAFAVGISMFLMVVTNTEHPPAAGLALGLVLDGFDFTVAVVTLLGLVLLTIAKRLLKKYLLDLV